MMNDVDKELLPSEMTDRKLYREYQNFFIKNGILDEDGLVRHADSKLQWFDVAAVTSHEKKLGHLENVPAESSLSFRMDLIQKSVSEPS